MSSNFFLGALQVITLQINRWPKRAPCDFIESKNKRFLTRIFFYPKNRFFSAKKFFIRLSFFPKNKLRGNINFVRHYYTSQRKIYFLREKYFYANIFSGKKSICFGQMRFSQKIPTKNYLKFPRYFLCSRAFSQKTYLACKKNLA